MSEMVEQSVIGFRELALSRVASMSDALGAMLDCERAEFDHWVKENNDYPPQGWNRSFREKIERLRSDIDREIEQAVSTTQVEGYLVMNCLAPWERHKAFHEFYEDLIKRRAALK